MYQNNPRRITTYGISGDQITRNIYAVTNEDLLFKEAFLILNVFVRLSTMSFVTTT